MEEKNNGGYSAENQNSGYTAEGRKLRPRRPRISSKTYSTDRDDSRGGYRDRRDSYNSSEDGNQSGRGGYHRSNSGYSRGGYDRGGRSDFHGGYGGDDRRSGGYSHDDSRRGGGYSHGGDRDSSRGGYSRGGYDRGGRSDFHGGYGDDRRSGGYSHDDSRRSGGYSRGGDRGRSGFSHGGNGKGGYKGGQKSRYTFSKDSGINDMIDKRPQLSKMEAEGVEEVQTSFPEEVRLNKFIANSGVCSRREADQMIQAGVVTVNGEVVTELGTKVNMLNDVVKFNGETLKGEKKVYIVMNKPSNYVTTSSDPHAERTVMDLLRKCEYRVFPVGRLDKNTTGVLMFTNDGEMAEKLTHPSFDKKKIYQVILDHDVTEEDRQKILDGIELNDGPIKADDIQFIEENDHRKMGIEIHSGKNRIVRRIFEALGYDVKALDRVYFAGLTKRGLKKGEWRFLTPGEANILRAGTYL